MKLKPVEAGLIVLMLTFSAARAGAQSVGLRQDASTALQAVSVKMREAAVALQPTVNEVAQDPTKAQYILDKNRSEALTLLKDQDESLKSLAKYELHEGYQLEREQTKDCQLSVAADRQTVTCAQKSFVPPDALLKAVVEYTDFAALMTNVASDREIDLHVESEPSEALFSIHPLYNADNPRSVTTTSDIPGLVRGIYEYTVVKSGMKTITFQINFARDKRSKLHCTFVPTTSTGPALPCTQSPQ